MAGNQQPVKNQFYYWKRKLSDELLDAVTTTFVSLPQILQTSESIDVKNTPLLESSTTVSSYLPDVILNSNGIEIKLFNSATSDLLKTFFEVINHA